MKAPMTMILLQLICIARYVVRTAIVVTVILAVGALPACGSPGDATTPERDDGEGTIRLLLPAGIFGASGEASDTGTFSASAVDTEGARTDAEILEILVLEEGPAGESGSTDEPVLGNQPTLHTSTVVSAADLAHLGTDGAALPLDISVAPGVYRLLLLVGTESGGTSCLLASGYSEAAVIVEENRTTPTTINLVTITHEVTVPDTVLAGETYTITASGDTNNSVLTTDSTGSTDTYRFQAKFDTESSLEVLNADFTGTAWTVIHTTTAPASEYDDNWYSEWLLAGPYITYKDHNTGAWIALDGSLSRKWRWLSYTILTESSHLWPEVAVPVVLCPSTTGVTINITWSW